MDRMAIGVFNGHEMIPFVGHTNGFRTHHGIKFQISCARCMDIGAAHFVRAFAMMVMVVAAVMVRCAMVAAMIMVFGGCSAMMTGMIMARRRR